MYKKTLVAVAISTALAMQASALSAQEADKAEESEAAEIETIIVTGVTRNTQKMEATFSINTISEEEMKRLAPHGAAELLGNIPGFFPEGGTAGETHNNVLVRGLPQAGGYRYVPNLIDGLPTYEEPEAPFMNNDVFIKPDLMTTNVEAVKGGPGGVLYSNALGAAVNYITRTGTQDFEGAYKIEVGDWGHVRNDFFAAGPINDNLTYAIGGYYRVADGIRDPGYTGNSGGQLRGNLLYISDDNSTEVKLQAHVINDKTNFYQNIPYSITNNRGVGTPDNPFKIDPSSVNNLGVDFGKGNTVSPQTSYYTLYNPDGSRLTLDISDGVAPKFNLYTFNITKDFENDWRLTASMRSTTGTNGFNALFNDPLFERSSLEAEQFARIQSFDGAIGASYANAVGVKAFYTDTVNGTDLSNATRAPAVIANNTPVYGKVDATSFVSDIRLSRFFDFSNQSHELTFGVYTSHYTYNVQSVFATALSDVGGNSRLVDLYAVDANDNQVGPSITDNGVLQPAILGLGADATMRTNALYLLDHITLLDGDLQLDIGGRYQDLEVDRVTTNSFNPGNSSNDFTPSDVVVGSTNDTLADNFVNVPDGKPNFASEEYDSFGWTVGANYRLTDKITTYASYADSFRLPGFEDYIFGGPATNPSTGEVARGDLVEDIKQYEGGVRFTGQGYELNFSGFYIDFAAKESLGATLDDLSATGTGGLACNTVPAPANCPKIRDSFRTSLKTKGLEFEGSYRPEWFTGMTLQGSIVWQDPKQGQDNAIRAAILETDTNGDGVNDLRQYDISSGADRRPRRQSQWLINLRPSYDFADIPLTVYGQVLHYSERFAADGDTNVTIYPGYTQINAGLLYAITNDMEFQFHISNLNDADSFTEGSSVTEGLRFANGDYTGVARPLLGRTIKASLRIDF
ncbi:TonB-dependent receptor [Rheinheimera sp. UJ51]|uniref:TonB-dependent receptor domain-containing protein n=1 Tax=Rheinheimera sp. UJ51 TaxID=2892446 RepID=UPI001E50803E|nr:TonB-dependent receptor [Rheinheimera sp. UJ51]MCC5451817.1 TonB-dependent receptor [Rheinheimera sp. UJ51]